MKRLSLEHRRKLSIGKIGENNPSWRGDKVTIDSLHQFMRTRLSEPDLCQNCGLVPPYDLVCVTGIYNREFHNWAYWCRKCHNISHDKVPGGTLRRGGGIQDPKTGRFIGQQPLAQK